ncbi:MAG: hypothetical protein LBS78_00910 [Endomicrobium sp.]|jgi:uncharacterized protein with PQ loop repeat|nr:hypothetical protein [Endomicrobium sp.]
MILDQLHLGQYVYSLGCAICNISYFPQINRICKTKQVGDISIQTQILLLIAMVFYISFALVRKAYVAFGVNSLSFLFIITLIVLKLKYQGEHLSKKQLS